MMLWYKSHSTVFSLAVINVELNFLCFLFRNVPGGPEDCHVLLRQWHDIDNVLLQNQ